MNDRLRTRLAAGGTIAALGVLATVALAAGSGGPAEQPVSSATILPPQVRTQVERRTVHVRRHLQERTQTAAAPAPPATTVPAPAAPATVTDGGGREHENETGDDHGGRGRGDGGDD